MNNSMHRTIRIAVTMGDPGGIGPEIALRAVVLGKWSRGVRFVLIGAAGVWEKYSRILKLPAPHVSVHLEDDSNRCVAFWDPPPSDGAKSLALWRPGRTGGAEGGASLHWVRVAARGCMDGRFDAMVTGPICKESIASAGCSSPGHTEYLARLAGVKSVGMMLIGGSLRVVLVTRHVPLERVPGMLSRAMVSGAVEMACKAVRWLRCGRRPVGVCALNPHAGENGLLGGQERRVIGPVVRRLRRRGLAVEGPVPADVIFFKALRGDYSAVVAMYHDQGLGPLKMHAFESGVNLTLGLPFVRTSPDHGTAFDIAGRGIAGWSSMAESIKLAAALARRKNPWAAGR